MLIIISVAAFVSTLLGGLFALRLKDRLHLILGFSAGAVIGVAFFDLMPEAFELAGKSHSTALIAQVMACGFLLYMLLDRTIFLHGHDEHDHGLRRASFGAGSLSAHSFLDGIGIGLAFQVSNVVGLVVALAVLAHDFSDGINTVNLVLKNHNDRKGAFRWLIVDALAPVLGVVATLFFTVPECTLGLVLALFAGFFLYIGASDLLPESHHNHPVRFTTLMTIFGATLIYVVIQLSQF